MLAAAMARLTAIAALVAAKPAAHGAFFPVQIVLFGLGDMAAVGGGIRRFYFSKTL